MEHPFNKEFIDQLMHFILSFIIITVAYLLGATFTFVSAFFLGLIFGVIREITEEDSFISANSLLDLTFWGLGGLTAGLVY